MAGLKIISACLTVLISYANILAGDNYYFGYMLGKPVEILGGVKLNETSYEASLGIDGGDASFCLNKLYNRSVYAVGVYKWEFPAFIGWGLKYVNSYHTFFGLRGIIYANTFIKNNGIEIFALIAPIVRLAPSYGMNIDLGVGMKFK